MNYESFHLHCLAFPSFTSFLYFIIFDTIQLILDLKQLFLNAHFIIELVVVARFISVKKWDLEFSEVTNGLREVKVRFFSYCINCY